jgi:hypothetical protein
MIDRRDIGGDDPPGLRPVWGVTREARENPRQRRMPCASGPTARSSDRFSGRHAGLRHREAVKSLRGLTPSAAPGDARQTDPLCL